MRIKWIQKTSFFEFSYCFALQNQTPQRFAYALLAGDGSNGGTHKEK